MGTQLLCRLRRGRVDGKAKPGCEAVQPQDAQRVLGEPLAGHTHRPYDAALQVGLPAKGVHKALFFIVGHGVDGKIPPGQVLPHIRHKVHLVRVAAICVGAFCTEGGDLVKGTALLHRYRAVLQAGGDAPLRAEQLHHLLRQSTGAQVPVVRCKAQQTVPHAAAHHVGCIARPVQGVQQLCRTLVHPDGHGCASSYCSVMLLPSKPHSAAGKMLCACAAYSSGSVIMGE